MKKIPPGVGHHGHHGPAPSSPGYSFGGAHDSQPPAYAPTYPDFKPIGPSGPSPYHSRKPSYASLFNGVFSASASPFKHPARPHSHDPSLPMEIDYDPNHPEGPNFAPNHLEGPNSAPNHYEGPNYGPSSSSSYSSLPESSHSGGNSYSPPSNLHHLEGPNSAPNRLEGSNHGPSSSSSFSSPPESSHLGTNSYGAPSHNTPPSTNYGYPVEPLRYKLPQSYADGGQPHAPQPQQALPAQIHITPTTNFIEYTNIQNADSQHLHQAQPLVQPPQVHENTPHEINSAPVATSQQMAEEVIKYLGKLQHQGAATNNQNNAGNPNPHLFFGVNVPLGGDVGGGEVQDESFPLYPPGTSPQDSPNQHAFIPTPLPPDNYPPSGGEYSEHQVAQVYPPNHKNHNPKGSPIDSYGNPVQVSNSQNLHTNHNYNNIQFLKPPQSKLAHTHNHHPNGVASSPRHRSKPEIDILRSVSFELGADGPIMHH